jgi:hypothetical protein
MLNSPLPIRGCRSWPVAPVSQDSFARRMRTVMQDTARWGGSRPCASARGAYRCAPILPSSAHEAWRPSVLVELKAPDGEEKNCGTNPITAQESRWFPRLDGKGPKPMRRPAGPAVALSACRCPSAVPFSFAASQARIPTLARTHPSIRPAPLGIAGKESHARPPARAKRPCDRHAERARTPQKSWRSQKRKAGDPSGALEMPLLDQQFGDLDRVEGGTLAQIVGDHPHRQPGRHGGVAAQA